MRAVLLCVFLGVSAPAAEPLPLFILVGQSKHGEAMANAYRARLADFIARVRSDFAAPRTPVVLARENRSPLTKPALMETVRAAIVAVAQGTPGVAWIDVDGLERVRGHHFTAAAQMEIGRRYARALLRLAPDFGLRADRTIVAEEPQAPAAGLPQVGRKDAFFGIHFDLHPHKSDTALGRDVSEAEIRAFLRRVRPDYIQYDCVGVPGYSGYPTKVGWPAPGIVKDSLAVWRKVTRAERVALLIHYCALWNEAAVEKHPDWAAVNAQGQRDKQVLSIFSPFAQQLLIPQLKEAATRYDLDGAWIDADSWVARLDYSPAALAEWKRQTGLDAAPKSRQEPRWADWKMFHRREFEKYLGRYVDALHGHSARFQIGRNWMYSLLAGVWPVGSAVDYLSGDYAQHGSTDAARAEARYFASNRKPWDLLAWGFHKPGLKSATQLKQEAAATIMHGGGWGIYYVPTRSGKIAEQITATVPRLETHGVLVIE